MSRKYFDKLMTGSGTSNQKVKSKFGEAMLKKMGWQDGKGLGKESNGKLITIFIIFVIRRPKIFIIFIYMNCKGTNF